ncbi:MAG TPA: lactonase family protein [Gemmata sp.]|nr:lactonase family protein [Gemmata sp.]
MSLSRMAIAAICATIVAGTVSADEYWVYFGTYTAKNGSKGIYRSKFDTATGKLSKPEIAAEMASPSFVNIHPNNKFLYAVGEGNDKEGGPVVAFAIDGKTGTLTKLNESKSGGPGPCHISVSPNGQFAIVANYGGGSMAIFKLDDQGKIASRTAFFQHKGSGPNKGRQEGPHAHCGFFEPKSQYALVADLGMDKVKVYWVDPKDGGVLNYEAKDIVMPPGSGPRHVAIAPDGKFAYVCGELDSSVNVIKLALADPGKSEVIQSLSTLPKPTPGNSTAECILSPNGKFVYVSNRVGDSIAVFKVGEDRKLTAAGHITGDIKIPRNFNIDPSGKWMLIASQDGGKVGVWELDATTGLGKETGETVPVSGCVCVKFVPVAK